MTIKEKIEKIKQHRLSDDELSEIFDNMDDMIRNNKRLTLNDYKYFRKGLISLSDNSEFYLCYKNKYFFKWSVIFSKTKLIEIIVENYNPNDDIEYSKEEIEFCLNDGYHRNVYSYVQYGFVMTDEYYNELRNKFKNDSNNKEIIAVLRRVRFLQKKKNKGIKYIKTKSL